ncbi:MAG: type II secretion system protein GspG [Phycisphaerales bacterium]|nr:type II secretion system protein GspG [Phycisphaerales bacterium]
MFEFIPLALTICMLEQEEAPSWIRQQTQDNLVSLEIASRKYCAEGKPDLWLVGVSHVANEAFYADIKLLLDELDVVLYESVRPDGARPPANTTPEQAVKSTKASMEFVADMGVKVAEEFGTMPESIDDIIVDSSLIDRRFSGWIDDASVDAWNRPFALQVYPEESAFGLWSYGSDGAIGGEGYAADIFVKRSVTLKDVFAEGVVETQADETVNIQAEFADMLELEFQLDSLPYEEPNWFCSDLTIGEVNKLLHQKGADTAVIDSLSGATITAKFSASLMRLVPMLDSLAGGGVVETVKLLMIELLSMDDSMELSSEMQPELMEVIIVDRNTEVLKDIAVTLEIVEGVQSIGVLYGAGHMDDFHQRLEILFDYKPTEECWFTAMSVNPSKSLLDEKEFRRMKMMLRYQMYKAKQAKEEAVKESE